MVTDFTAVSTELSTMIGGAARVWRFVATHDLLAIEIRRSLPGKTITERRFLILEMCEDVPGFALEDENVRVVCAGASLQRECSW